MSSGPSSLVQLWSRLAQSVVPADTLARVRDGRAWQRWAAELSPELLHSAAHVPYAVKQSLFKQHVHSVDLETHARCNRVRSSCPDVTQDRRSDPRLTDDRLLHRLFSQLAEINYDRELRFARYSEPLVNRRALLSQARVARDLLPGAKLTVVTNTDYLTPSVLEVLSGAGIDALEMRLHLLDGETWTHELARQHSDKLRTKLGLRLRSRRTAAFALIDELEYEGISLLSICRDASRIGDDDEAAASVDPSDTVRTAPCREPFERFVVDFNGAVLPCAQMQSERRDHEDAIIGDLSEPDTNIFELYAVGLAAWRKRLAAFGPKDGPCANCNYGLPPANTVRNLERALQSFERTRLATH